MNYSIAIDGPAGAGKSTVAKRIAKDLGFIYVDTGAMYRAMTYYFVKNNVNVADSASMSQMCDLADITIVYQDGEQQVMLNGENVTPYLRTEEVGNMTSVVSVNGEVRRKLVELQQKLARTESVVMDGRDIGTCVLPQAQLKIYLTASSLTRANRRYKELTEKGIACNIEEIETDIIDRDERDMNREISPLRQAEDAILVDSSDMTIEEVVEHIKGLFQERK